MIKSIRNFEINELIATGGMAAIYKAVQTSLDRVVAIKVLHGHLAQDPNFIQRFEREAKAAANLKHENVVNIIDFGKDEEIYFIAMEYVEGRSLKDLISQVKVFPVEIVLTITTCVCKGLSHAHQKGVIHRDIKPANILIGFDGTVKIADFGLAQAQDLTSITITGAIVGTPAYMSPEQAAGRKVDNRSDLFSLGIILYEMMTGEKPFPGENYSSVITRILTAAPKRPIEMNPLIPMEMNQVVERMLEKDPDKRYADVDSLLVEVEGYAKKASISVSEKHIIKFVKEPEQYAKGTLDKRKREHFDRGVYYMTLGLEKIDDAIDEFTKVIFLDPADVQAKDYIEKLKAKKEKMVKKPEVEPRQAPAPPKPKPAVRSLPKGHRGVRDTDVEKRSAWPVLIPALVIVVLVGVFMARRIALRAKPPVVPRIPYGALTLSSSPSGAGITLDGRDLVMTTPARVDSLKPGPHVVFLSFAGYKAFVDTVQVEAESVAAVTALLEKEKTVIPEREKVGPLTVRSQPAGAGVKIDGRDTGERTPCVIRRLAIGTYRVSVEKAGYEPVTVTRQVAARRLNLVNVRLVKKAGVIEYAYLKLTVNPWAKVFIDGKYVETTPIGPIKVEAGQHVIKLTNPSLKSYTETIDFPTNQTISRTIQLAPGEGYLRITVNPWADVYLDDQFIGTTPMRNVALSPGSHRLKLVNPKFDAHEEKITIIADEILKKHVNLQ